MITLKAMPKQCNKCKSIIIPPRDRMFTGEVVTCSTCKTVYTLVSWHGLGQLQAGDGMVSIAISLLRAFDKKIRYRIHFLAYDLIYFSDEEIADRYSEIFKATGGSVSWYGEGLLRGRSPEEDIIREGVELFAVSR